MVHRLTLLAVLLAAGCASSQPKAPEPPPPPESYTRDLVPPSLNQAEQDESHTRLLQMHGFEPQRPTATVQATRHWMGDGATPKLEHARVVGANVPGSVSAFGKGRDLTLDQLLTTLGLSMGYTAFFMHEADRDLVLTEEPERNGKLGSYLVGLGRLVRRTIVALPESRAILVMQD